MDGIEVNILGCSSAKPTLRHNPSCTVLNVYDTLFMIDCGEGTQKQMIKQRLNFNRLNHIFLTHLHGDHVLGLPGLLSTLALHGKEGFLTVYTFAEGIEWINREMDFFGRNLSYELRFVEINPKVPMHIYEDKRLTIRTLPLNHRVQCVGYIFEEKEKLRHIDKPMCDFHGVPVSFLKNLQKGEDFIKPDGEIISNIRLTKPPTPSKSYAHIGDTAYSPQLANQVGPVDLLYHETTYIKANAYEAHQRGHSTAAEAADFAKLCGAKRLLTGHYSSRYKDENVILVEAQKIFPNTILGNEGLKLKL